jgi:hypothetical protein
MRHPQLIVYESDGQLAALLRETAAALKWAIREPRQIDNCLRLLDQGGPSVLVLKIDCDLVRQQARLRDKADDHDAERKMREVTQTFSLLEQVTRQFPDVRTVVVGAHDDSALAELAWDLSADFVVFPPFSWEHLPSIVTGLMELPAAEQPVLVAEE